MATLRPRFDDPALQFAANDFAVPTAPPPGKAKGRQSLQYPNYEKAFPGPVAAPGFGNMAPNAGPALPGGMTPGAGPALPGGMAVNAGPSRPGGMAPNAGPALPGGMTPNAGPIPAAGANTGPALPGGMTPNAGPGIPGGMTPNAGPNKPPGSWPFAEGGATPAAPDKPSGGWFRNKLRAATSYAGAGANTAAAVTKDVGKAALPTVAGFAAADQINSLRQGALDSAPAFVPPAERPGDIPRDPRLVAPRADAGSFLNQSETGRNIGNAVMAMPGGSGAVKAVQAGLRLLPTVGRAAQAAEVAAKVAPMVPAVAQGYAGGDIANPGKASAVPERGAVSDRNENYSHEQDHTVGPATPGNPAGSILRTGNNYSGANIKFGADIRNPDGTLVNGGDPSNPKGFGVTSLDTSEGHRQNLLELQRNAAERAAAPAPAGAMGFGGRTVVDDVVAKGKSGGPDLSRLPPVRRAQMEATLRQSQDANANAMAIAGLHDSTARAGMDSAQAIAAMHDATQRRSNDQNNATSLRGQDITYAGHMAPLQLAALQRGMHAQAYGAIGAGVNGAPITADQHLAAAKLLHSQGLPEQAAKAEAAAASMTALGGAQDAQSAARAKGTPDLFKPFFTVKDKDGNDKFDEVGAAKAAATVRGIYGADFDKLPDDKKRAATTEIVAKQRNMDAERQVMPGFIDRAKDLVGMYEKPPEATAPRDLRGGKIERAGLISPMGVSRHSTLLRLPNGETINYGEVNGDQLREIGERAQLRPTR